MVSIGESRIMRLDKVLYLFTVYPHQVRKKAKEYEEWLRLSGRVLTPDELIKNIMQRIND